MAPTPRITLLVASLHVLFYLLLSMRVMLHRKALRIGVGTGDDEGLTRRVRVHANFAEYVPLALLLLALLDPPGTVQSRARLEEKMYGWGEEVESNTIEVYIHALRKKLGSDFIRNVRGVGYKVPGDA